MNKENILIAKKTLQFLANKSWNEIKINEVINLKSKKNTIKSKKDLLKNINRYVDYLLSKELISIEKSTPKDMLFEVIMTRFDILQKYRNSFVKLFNLFKINPHKSFILIPSFLDSMILTASLANIDLKGVTGSLKVKGIFIIYIATSFEWVNDSSQSLEKTMTVLDSYLDKSFEIIKYIKK